jgi:hypothetical protein
MNDNVIPFRGKEKFCEAVKQEEPDRFYVQEKDGIFYILDRQWPSIKAGDMSALHCNSRQNAEAFADNVSRNSKRKAFHVSEMSDEDIEAIRNAKVPPGHEHLDELDKE